MSEIASPSKQRPLYAGGPSVSSIAWGMWRFAGSDIDAAERRIRAVLDAGVTLFDTADVYGFGGGAPFGAAELLLGAVLERSPGLRSRMVLASKGGIVPGRPYDSSAGHLAAAIDASLCRLKIDHLDLWQVHRPDILTHPEELARTLETAHRNGKIGAVGVSNYSPAQLDALADFLAPPIVSTQPEFSPLAIGPVSNGVLDQALRRRMAVLAWSPLAGGRVADPLDPRGRAVAAALDARAHRYGVSRAIAAYSWIMAHPARPIPIVGSQSLERIAEIPRAFEVSWTRTDWYAVLAASNGEPLP